MPTKGLEPSPAYTDCDLNAARLPFRHVGISNMSLNIHEKHGLSSIKQKKQKNFLFMHNFTFSCESVGKRTINRRTKTAGAHKKSKKNLSGCIIRDFSANLSVKVFRKTAGNDSGG